MISIDTDRRADLMHFIEIRWKFIHRRYHDQFTTSSVIFLQERQSVDDVNCREERFVLCE